MAKWVADDRGEVACRIARDAHRQAAGSGENKGQTGFAPDVDGKFLTEPVVDTYAAGKQAHVPLLAGWNADEGSFFAMRGMTARQWKGMAKGLFKDRADEFLKLYPGDTDAQALRSAIDYGSDCIHCIRNMEVAGGASQDRRRAGVSLSL